MRAALAVVAGLALAPGAALAQVPAGVPPIVVPTAGVVPTASALTVHDGALYGVSWGLGSVSRMAILPGGLLAPAETVAEGFSSPLGVAFAPDGTMFVSDSHAAATEGRSTAGRVQAVAPDGSRTVVVDELPNGRHSTNNLLVREGRLYITNGNATDDGVRGGDPEAPLSGTLLSVPLDARDLGPDSPEIRVDARGMRNNYDVAFRPGTDEAWMATNGPDALDPWGDDLLHRTDLSLAGEPADFGFPGCVWSSTATPAKLQNPGVTDPCDGTEVAPEAMLGLHVSANGLDFGPADAFWDGDLFIAEFGSFNGIEGHRVVRVPIDAAGRAGEPETLVPAITPLDLVFGPPGTGLYVADFGSGQVSLLRAPGL